MITADEVLKEVNSKKILGVEEIKLEDLTACYFEGVKGQILSMEYVAPPYSPADTVWDRTFHWEWNSVKNNIVINRKIVDKFNELDSLENTHFHYFQGNKNPLDLWRKVGDEAIRTPKGVLIEKGDVICKYHQSGEIIKISSNEVEGGISDESNCFKVVNKKENKLYLLKSDKEGNVLEGKNKKRVITKRDLEDKSKFNQNNCMIFKKKLK